MWDESRGDFRTVLDAWAFIKDTETWYPRYRGWEVFDVSLVSHAQELALLEHRAPGAGGYAGEYRRLEVGERDAH